jgi:protein-S-isoprenylcysteine O-methyltransferase Ste14
METRGLLGERDGANPYRPPLTDSLRPGMGAHLDGPSAFDVAALVTIQVAAVLAANSGSWLLLHRSWSGIALLAIVVGAIVFALLKRTRKPAPWSATYRRRLAMMGAGAWICVSGALLGLSMLVYSTRIALPAWWLFVGGGLLCLLYLGATLFGLWLSSRNR